MRRPRASLRPAPDPTAVQPGQRSKEALEDLLPAGSVATVELDVQERDRYGRLLAYLYREDGLRINEELLRTGYAVVGVYPPNVAYVDRFRAIEDSARVAE
ncbi:MAG: hypothetical protein GEU90_19220 [Gemmatimonas sp.]|nr:hypothetical protein [Gemmatimonas sp.]